MPLLVLSSEPPTAPNKLRVSRIYVEIGGFAAREEDVSQDFFETALSTLPAKNKQIFLGRSGSSPHSGRVWARSAICELVLR